MGDVVGGIVQDALWIGGFFMLINGWDEGKVECVSSNRYGCISYDTEEPEPNALFFVGLGAYTVNFIFNIIRSASYDKPGSVAYHNRDGFNIAVKPSRRGELMPYFLYSKAF